MGSALKEDAEFIVRACNAHDELVEAWQDLLRVCEDELDPKRVPEMAIAKAALKVAKEEKAKGE